MAAKLNNLIRTHSKHIKSYITLIAGSVGRLVVSLLYFILVANTLSVEEFGLFATTSATGIILSRFFAFGLVSPTYRIATSKHRLLGAYTSGLIVGGILCLPIIFLAAWGLYYVLFSEQMAFSTYIAIIVAEVVFWRGLEITIIISNGLNRFIIGSSLVVLGTLAKMVAAIYLSIFSQGTLADWALLYAAGNLCSCLVAIGFFYPRVQLRWEPSLYVSRWVESVSVAASEIVYAAQSEIDKLVVLAVGGPQIAGIYAILIRLVDLTALPIRSLTTLLTQQIMRSKALLRSLRNLILIELSIFLISSAAILAMLIAISIFPNILGRNVADFAPYLGFILLVPAFRNLTEVHSELLYAVNLTVRRTINAAILGFAKLGLLAFVLSHFLDDQVWLWTLNAVFALIYLCSLVLSYLPIQRVAPLVRKQENV